MPKDELTLNDGTSIILKTLHQSQTYEGLLEVDFRSINTNFIITSDLTGESFFRDFSNIYRR